MSQTFVPARIAALEPSIQRIADELLDHLEATGPDSVVDLVDGFAYPLPFRVISELLGVPEGDRLALHPRCVPDALSAVDRYTAHPKRSQRPT